jgi:hypothetical protein
MGTTHEVQSLSASCHSCSQPLAEETGLHWGSDTGLSAPAREGRRIQWPVMSAGATCAMSAAAAARTIAASRDVTTTCASPARTAPRQTVAATQVTSVSLSFSVSLSLSNTHTRAHTGPIFPGGRPHSALLSLTEPSSAPIRVRHSEFGAGTPQSDPQVNFGRSELSGRIALCGTHRHSAWVQTRG